MNESIPAYQITDKIIWLLCETGQCTGALSGTESRPLSAAHKDKYHKAVIPDGKNHEAICESLSRLDPCSLQDFLKVHEFTTNLMTEETGSRPSEKMERIAESPAVTPTAQLEPLFAWLNESSEMPLIRSCLFHYALVHLHPFTQDNEQLAGFWQSLFLQKWMPVFSLIEIESLIQEKPAEYRKALQMAEKIGEATGFVEWMLERILEALREQLKSQNKLSIRDNVTANVTVNVRVNERHVRVKQFDNKSRLLELLSQESHLSARVLASRLNLSERQIRRILARLKEDKKIIRHGAAKNGWWEVL